MKKYVACYAADGEFEFFDTFEEAKNWLLEWDDQGEGFTVESADEGNFIAVITHVSKFIETDRKENYTAEEIEDGAWSSDYDFVGYIEYVPIENRENSIEKNEEAQG